MHGGDKVGRDGGFDGQVLPPYQPTMQSDPVAVEMEVEIGRLVRVVPIVSQDGQL